MKNKSSTSRRLFSWFLAIVMIIVGTFADIPFIGNGVKTEAAPPSTLYPKTLNEMIITEAAKYLGYGYRGAGWFSNTAGGDCVGLINRVLQNIGFDNYGFKDERNNDTMSYTVENYVAGINDKSLTFRVNVNASGQLDPAGTTKRILKDGDGIYFTRKISDYTAKKEDPAYAGWLIVLQPATNGVYAANAQDYTQIPYESGDIVIYPRVDTNSHGHMAIIEGIHPVPASTKVTAAQVKAEFVDPTTGAQAGDQGFWNIVATHRSVSKYAEYMAGIFNTKYTSKALRAGMQWARNDVLAQWKTGVYKVAENMWDVVPTVYNNWNQFPGTRQYNSVSQNYYLMTTYFDDSYPASNHIVSDVWRIEALSEDQGVAITNKMGGKDNNALVLAMSFNNNYGFYYGLNAQKFTSDGTLDFPGPNGASGTYKNTLIGSSGIGLGGGKATFSVYRTIASDGTLSDAVIENKTIDTPRGGDDAISGNPGGPDNLFSGLYSDNATETFYIKEISSEYGQLRPGVWKVTMSGSYDPTGKGSTITSAKYYSSNAACGSDTNNTGGTSILNEDGHSGSWFIDGRTAFYIQGVSGVYANFEVVNRMTYEDARLISDG